MKANQVIEETLAQTPAPQVPGNLLSTLERQIRLPRPEKAPQTEERRSTSSLLEAFRRSWGSWIGLGGATVTLVGALLIFSDVNTRSIAKAAEAFNQLKSVRMIRYLRSGPAVHVWRDRSVAENVSPNFSTPLHPNNPLVTEEMWFRRNPHNPSIPESVLIRESETTWQYGNWNLTIDSDSGERTFRLTSPTRVDQMGAPMQYLSDSKFTEINSSPPPSNPILKNCWQGEHRVAGMSINGRKNADMVVRVWIEEESQFARRVEIVSHDHSDLSAPWIQQAYEFHDFNQSFSEDVFHYSITEADAAQIGLTLAELGKLSQNALTIELKGEQGVEVKGTVRDSTQTREISGKLPFVFVHDSSGATSMDFRTADGETHSFGISGDGLGMSTVTARIIASIDEDGSFEFSSSKL